MLILMCLVSFSVQAQKLSHIKQIWSNSGIPTIEEVSELNEMKVWLIRLNVDIDDEVEIYLENEKFFVATDSSDFYIQLILFTDKENNYLDHLELEFGKLVHHLKSYDNELYAVERNGLFAGQKLEKIVKWDENLVKTNVFEFENEEWKISIQ